jgi:sporulation protein YlmC with PRC-barrel domain
LPAAARYGSISGMKLELGCPVSCADGDYGKLADVVVDPTSRRLTHLVVEPHGSPVAARLVPVEVAAETADGLALSVTRAQAKQFEPLRESAYVRLGEFPAKDPEWDVGIEETYALPYYAGADGLGLGPVDFDPHVIETYDRVPKGEVELRRTSAVVTSDGHRAGHIDGFVVDGDHITHVVLEHGHLWGRRDVAIPISAVERLESDTVVLGLSKDEVGALPKARVGRAAG